MAVVLGLAAVFIVLFGRGDRGAGPAGPTTDSAGRPLAAPPFAGPGATQGPAAAGPDAVTGNASTVAAAAIAPGRQPPSSTATGAALPPSATAANAAADEPPVMFARRLALVRNNPRLMPLVEDYEAKFKERPEVRDVEVASRDLDGALERLAAAANLNDRAAVKKARQDAMLIAATYLGAKRIAIDNYFSGLAPLVADNPETAAKLSDAARQMQEAEWSRQAAGHTVPPIVVRGTLSSPGVELLIGQESFIGQIGPDGTMSVPAQDEE